MSRKTAVWILGNQLDLDNHALRKAEAEDGRGAITVILIESKRKLSSRPYHRKKLVLLLSATRHFAHQLSQSGYHVEQIKAESFSQGLQQAVSRHQPERLVCMAAADYNGRQFQRRLPRLLDAPVEILPNQQFLIAEYDPYPDPEPGKRYLQEYFYRKMRRHFDVLMDGDVPSGGQWNYDKENRKPLPDDLEPPPVASFEADEITRVVMAEVENFPQATGSTQGFSLAVTRRQALQAFDDFLAARLRHFGPYEDAMSGAHATLYHSLLSPYLNIGLLRPLELIRRVEEAYQAGKAPINSVEGFIRQVLGWREYMYWQYWRLMPELYENNFWQAQRPLPLFFWDGQTDMNCLRQVLQRALESGYNHHIERLMILANFALLAGLQPLEVNEWFLALYVDAFDWVMGPNVIGMGLNADGGIIASKPYIASANYINKMSDYCKNCTFDRRQRTGANACPFNTLYWNFLIANEETLRANPRLGPNVLGLRHLDKAQREDVQQDADRFLDEFAGD